MKIRRSPEDSLQLQVRQGRLVRHFEVGHFLAIISNALNDDTGEWLDLEHVGFEKLDEDEVYGRHPASAVVDEEVGGSPVIVKAETIERDDLDVQFPDPEPGVKPEDRTWRVWKVVGISKDGRPGDWPVRAYSEAEFQARLAKLVEGGFEVQRVLPPPYEASAETRP